MTNRDKRSMLGKAWSLPGLLGLKYAESGRAKSQINDEEPLLMRVAQLEGGEGDCDRV